MKFIIGKKVEMTQIFDDEGNVSPATIISAEPIVVTQLKDKSKDGYSAVQVGYGKKQAKNIKKPQIGHLKELGNLANLKEFKVNDVSNFEVGKKIDVSVFSVGDKVSVSAISKGKGFQGVVKRHGFKGGPRTHGQKHSEREPGSIGSTGPQKVIKGKRMAGRTGSDRITVKNLKVIGIDQENSQILIKGALPGRRGTVVEISGK